MQPDIWSLYPRMLKSRLFEEEIARLWQEGLISGEMHSGTGEEAIIAGVVTQLQEGDAMALDHRGTAALLMRGVDPVLLLRELLGKPDGLCAGMGGHMHLFSREYLAASSGIVGAAGPTAAGFALSAQHLRPGTIAVAFFGEAAMNQGMLMESMNLASAWKLPVLFVCKNDNWSITTRSTEVTGGDLLVRARGLGMPAVEVDGLEVSEVWEAARIAIEHARTGHGPTFLYARCVHLDAHFLGFQLTRGINHPLKELPGVVLGLLKAFLHPGGTSLGKRLAGLKKIMATMLATRNDPRRKPEFDPVRRTRNLLASDPVRLQEVEERIKDEVNGVIRATLGEVQP